MTKLYVAVWLLLLPTLSYTQETQRTIRASVSDHLGALARATTLTELESQWNHAPKDYPHRAVYAAMYSKLGGMNPAAVLISAVPTSGKEMEALYDAQDTKQGQDMAVTEAYHRFYSHLADALERNPERLPQFLRMIHAFDFVDNVDEWPWLCGLASKIYKAHPDAYMSAVNRLQPKFKREAMDCKQPPDAP
jgi:hypothetical protein